MIKHIVMWKMRGDDADERLANAKKVQSSMQSLRGKVPGLLTVEVGIDESRVDYAFDVVLYSEFDSSESLAAYATHPEHERVKREMAELRVARHQVDYAI